MLLTTYSIVARCPRTGQLGAAVATAVPSAGPLVIHIAPGVGAVATQAWVNPYLGIDGLARLRAGRSAEEALADVLAADAGRETRQLGIVDGKGRAASFTGTQTSDWQGHELGEGFAVQGNTLAGPGVIADMAAAARRSADLPLEERLMQVLEAGQAAGGDKRGKQSAALKVVGTEDYALVDLRVDDAADPVAELRRVLELTQVQVRGLIENLPRRSDPIGIIPPEAGAILGLPPQQRPQRR